MKKTLNKNAFKKLNVFIAKFKLIKTFINVEDHTAFMILYFLCIF